MIEWTALLVPATIALLLSLVILPASQANRYPRLLRRWVTALLAIQSVSVLLLAIEAAVVGGLPISFACFGSRAGWGQLSTIYIDPVSILMLLMVSTVSFVVSRFSIRYLDGETSQGSYFRWLAFTTAAVSTMVVAGNLLLFFAAWVMTSAGLHRLLLHYGHREAAQQAAWTKVTISRIGDGFLLAAVVLTVRTFGTGDFAELFERATAVAEGGQVTMAHQAIAWLLVIAAALKSAQFPFHTWLPNTMETPTPVSALMHAGIVNAGGYLVIRASKLIALAPETLAALAAIGAVTACFAGVVMMTQTSVKRALAYSTIAQMGFMMLQCGLGAFSAAMLHILAHSFYKANAFLTSGSVLVDRAAASGAAKPAAANRPNALLLLAVPGLAVAVLVSAFAVAGVEINTKPGGWVLAIILGVAISAWGWQLIQLRRAATTLIAFASIPLLCLVYVATFAGLDSLIAPAVADVGASLWTSVLSLDVVLAFAALFLLQLAVMHRAAPSWLEQARVHAAKGFYIDAIYARWFGSLQRTP